MITLDSQLNLVSNKLAIQKTEGQLALFKYSRKVMYDYLWFTNPRLMECRGHVYDLYTSQLVQVAPRKSFNYGENGWWSDVNLNQEVTLYRKYNGYMACATMHSTGLVVTTTGSFGGLFQNKAHSLVKDQVYSKDYTDVYEIIADFDPHIVDEGSERAVYLGSRCKKTGMWFPSSDTLSFKGTLRDALQFVNDNDRSEGYMMFSDEDENRQIAAKLKTPYYVGKKILMRAGPQRVAHMYGEPNDFVKTLPSMFTETVKDIVAHVPKDDWLMFTEQKRRAYIEATLN